MHRKPLFLENREYYQISEYVVATLFALLVPTIGEFLVFLNVFYHALIKERKDTENAILVPRSFTLLKTHCDCATTSEL